MPNYKQKTFEFIINHTYNKDDFILSNANLEAYQAIKNPIKWPDRRLIIVGESGSGKSHLARIWQSEQQSYTIKPGGNVFDLDPILPALICEDIEFISDEKFLLHLINFCSDNSIYLLMNAKKIIDFELPDLKSRVNATYKVSIKPADEDLLRVILLKNCSDRQLVINEEIANFIFSHSERSYDFIRNLIIRIDRLAIVKKRRITIPLIKEVLKIGS
jgi:chromosomal replication initiation ATPase DnaA